MHDRVADKSAVEYVLNIAVSFLADLRYQFCQSLAYYARHLLFATRMHHHVRDAAHQIFAKPDLRIHPTNRGKRLAAGQLNKMHGNRG